MVPNHTAPRRRPSPNKTTDTSRAPAGLCHGPGYTRIRSPFTDSLCLSVCLSLSLFLSLWLVWTQWMIDDNSDHTIRYSLISKCCGQAAWLTASQTISCRNRPPCTLTAIYTFIATKSRSQSQRTKDVVNNNYNFFAKNLDMHSAKEWYLRLRVPVTLTFDLLTSNSLAHRACSISPPKLKFLWLFF